MIGGLRIGKIFGIEIDIHGSWIFIFLLVALNLALGVFPHLHPEWNAEFNWILGIIAALLFFLSVLLHELAHSIVAKLRNLPVHRITLFLFGGVSNLEKEPESAKTEFLMAIVGPATSIVLGLIFLFLSGQEFTLTSTASVEEQKGLFMQLSPMETLLVWLGSVNILVGVFNLIPGFPLDGGRVFRSIVWAITKDLRRSTQIAAAGGQLVGFTFILIGILMIFGVNVPVFGTGLGGIWLALIGWFLATIAAQSYEQMLTKSILGDTRVKEILHDDEPFHVPPDISINELVDEYMIGTDRHAFPVVENNELKGLITLEDIQKIPREQWHDKKISKTMTSFSRLITAKPNDKVADVMDKLTRTGVGQLPIVKDKKLLALVSRQDIILWISLIESK